MLPLHITLRDTTASNGMDENITPDIDNSNVPSQKKKIPRQKKYSQGTYLNALCKKIRIQRKLKIPTS